MSTSLEDAMEEASYLPERSRLLVGYGTGIEEMDWIVGNSHDPRFLSALGDKSVEDEIARTARDFLTGDSQMAMTFPGMSRNSFVVAIFGASSVEKIIELLQRTAGQFTEMYVTSYLGEKKDQWKKPLATVLQFRPRPQSERNSPRSTARRDLTRAMAECAELLLNGYDGHERTVASLIDRSEQLIETEKAGVIGPWERSELAYARTRLLDGWLGLALTAAGKALAVSALPQAEYAYGWSHGNPQA